MLHLVYKQLTSGFRAQSTNANFIKIEEKIPQILS